MSASKSSDWRKVRDGEHASETLGMSVRRQVDDETGIEWAIWGTDDSGQARCYGLRRTYTAAKERAAEIAQTSESASRPVISDAVDRAAAERSVHLPPSDPACDWEGHADAVDEHGWCPVCQ